MKKYLSKIHRYKNNIDRKEYDLFLGQNERNLPLPKELFSKFTSSIKDSDIFFYPDYKELNKKLSKFLNLLQESFIITPGSDYGIKMVFETTNFSEGDNVISTSYCFPMYSVYCDIFNVDFKTVKYIDLRIDVDNIISSIDDKTKLIFLANPNSPLGDYISRADIIRILNKGVHLVVDEAYIESTDRTSCAELTSYYKNLTVLRTFSKAYGAAGLRVGLLISNPSNIENYYSKIRLMYEVNSIGAKYIEFILDNKKHFSEYIDNLKYEKKAFADKLKQSDIEFIDTDASWIFVKRLQKGRDLLQEFNDKKIHVRTLKLPNDDNEWIKLNYDLKLKEYDLNLS